MTRFLQKSKLAIPALAALLSQACTEVDKRLGEDFLPPNQGLKVQVRDATGFISLKNITLDSSSMPTSGFSVATLGCVEDERLGKTSAGFVAQFLPASYSFEFEEGVTGFDSVCFVLGFSSTYGSSSTPMTVEMYELTDNLSIDSVYYGTPEFAKSISTAGNLAAADNSGVTAESSSARIKLTDTDGLYNRLFSNTSSADSFLTAFKGLYVKVKDTNGCIKSVSLVNNTSSYSYASSAIVGYYHYRYTDSETETEKDSVTSFTFHVFSATPRFNVFEHDNSRQLTADTAILYMQGLVGVATQLEVSEDSLAAWTGTGDEKKNYAVSRAELVLHVQDTTDYARLDAYATQLQCIERLSDANGYAAIWDMYASDGSFSSAFDGAINRSLMQYSLNLTHYFNSAVKDGTVPPLILIPYSYTSDASSVLINNTSKKPQLKITYVEIKK